MSGSKLLVTAAALALAGVLAVALTTPGTRDTLQPLPALARALSDGQRAAVRSVVREYLIENPTVIVEALDVLQAHQEASERSRMKLALIEHRDALIATPGDPSIGPATASVTIVEFFDYNCPYCKRVTDSLLTLAEQDSDLRVVFKEFPILGDASVIASRAALAAAKQGKYPEFHVALMRHPGKLSIASIEQAAQTVGLDLDQLRQDMRAPDIDAALNANHQLAQALGVNGTPAFVIGDQLIPGAIEPARLRDLIARQRAGQS